ncbi:MAG: hypothetical protein M0Z49_13105 [Chloroflexi bacterium]|nr:hypothetical protein [Chloroflexota bacterium]
MPPLRPEPPFLMLEAIEREPALAEQLASDATASRAASEIAALLRSAATSGWPAAVVGCGTSEHVAMAACETWNDAWLAGERAEIAGERAGLAAQRAEIMPERAGVVPAGGGLAPARQGLAAVARQALEAALDPWPGATIGITHEGGSAATVGAMRAARERGARVGVVTAAANGPAAGAAEALLCTGTLDLSWCHTIAYVTPVVAAALVGDALSGHSTEPAALRAPLDAGLDARPSAAALAAGLAGSGVIVVAASGVDRVAGRELALKIEEAAYVPTTFRDLETILHGHVPAMNAATGLVLLLSGGPGLELRAARARQLLGAVGRVGVRSGAILAGPAADAIPDVLLPAGRVTVPTPRGLAAPVASLLATAVPLQLTTYELAVALGTNPDALRREQPQYLAAARAAST